MTRRVDAVKTILWTIMGVLAVVTAARFKDGLGAVTNLSDAAPWGLWIAFDVMSGVALAAGGFTIAAAVYIFRLERYHQFARPAVLTAFLGYTAVAAGLMYDLGLPWHIWHPLVYPQPHSVLFEVAMCVMLYLTVLGLEFSPVVLEHPLFNRPAIRVVHRVLVKATIPLVILGIMLSTLHQSSLGSLFLITPYRLHPLWYSPNIWLLFFVSAVGVGLMMVTLESYFSAWLFGHPLPSRELAGFAKAAAVVLLLYAGLRLGDLAWRGALVLALQPTPAAALFWLELTVSALVPGLLLSIPAVRANIRALPVVATLAVIGIMGYRFDVSIVAFARPAGASYFPSWMELVVSIGIVGAAALVFIFFVERLKVYPEERAVAAPPVARPRLDPYAGSLLTPVLWPSRRYSAAFVTGAVVTLPFVAGKASRDVRPERVPVVAARAVEGTITPHGASPGYTLALTASAATNPGAGRGWLLVIDGNRDGRVVLFPHDLHESALGGDRSCATCHHANLPFQRNSRCAECHRDMYSRGDIFEHGTHIADLGGNGSCRRCHAGDGPKTRATSTRCVDCHAGMESANSRIAPARDLDGYVVGYVDAMHGLCIGCHTDLRRSEPQKHPTDFAQCRNCHRGATDRAIERMAPYVTGGAAPIAARLGG